MSGKINYKEKNLLNKDNYLVYDLTSLTKKDKKNFICNYEKIIVNYLRLFVKTMQKNHFKDNYNVIYFNKRC